MKKQTPPDHLSFERDWNKKLKCDYFPTYRVHSPKYELGNVLKVHLKGAYLFDAAVVQNTPMPLNRVTDMVAYLDAAMDAAAFRQTVYRLYGHKWTMEQIDQANFCWVLLMRLHPHQATLSL